MNSPQIELAFQKALRQLGWKSNFQLVAKSDLDLGRRTYKNNGRIFKLILDRYACTSIHRQQSPHGEYNILSALIGCPGVPQEVTLQEQKDAIILSYKILPGEKLCLTRCKLLIFIRVSFSLSRILYAISKRGICHNDIKADNILVSAGQPFLIDFDQSTKASFLQALASNFIGWNKMTKTHSSFLRLLRNYVVAQSPIAVIEKYRTLRNSKFLRNLRLWLGRLPPLPQGASINLRHIYSAWEMARRSDANAPNAFLCYYSLTFEGFQLPGERPWEKRWTMLKDISDFSGKRILELGCNLSLLSCHLLSLSDAAAALCVDRDADILAAAQKVAAAYGVTPYYRQLDFDDNSNWENEVALFNPDIVTALSVLNWVNDKDRFLSFIGRFNEVILEGHDSEEVERSRLLKQGFKHVVLVAMSERNRPVLHAYR